MKSLIITLSILLHYLVNCNASLMEEYFAKNENNFAYQYVLTAGSGNFNKIQEKHNQIQGNISVSSDIPIEPDMEWRLNSITKSITVTLMTLLQNFDFDAPIQNYIKDFQVHEDFSTKRLRDFMNHRSGLEDKFLYQGALEILEDNTLSTKEQRTKITKHILTFPIQKRSEEETVGFRYSNFGYLILGNIIEITYKENKYSFEKICQYIFEKKLNIKVRFKFSDPKHRRILGHYDGKMAKTNETEFFEKYLKLEKTKTKNIFLSHGGFPSVMNPAAGAIMNHENVHKYGQWHAKRILKLKKKNLLFQTYLTNEEYNLGWEIVYTHQLDRETLTLSHGGSNFAWTSNLTIYVEFYGPDITSPRFTCQTNTINFQDGEFLMLRDLVGFRKHFKMILLPHLFFELRNIYFDIKLDLKQFFKRANYLLY